MPASTATAPLVGILLVTLALATGVSAHPALTAPDTDTATAALSSSEVAPDETPLPAAAGVGPVSSPALFAAPDDAWSPLDWFGVERADDGRVAHAPAPQRLDGPGAGPDSRSGSAGPGNTDDLEFVCPDPPNGLPFQPTTATSDMVIYTCPYLIRDGKYSLGNGAIALDHADHNNVVFTSLHGGAGDGQPYPHARGQVQVHTTFTSTSQGVEWFDQPPNPTMEPSREARGTDNDVAMDANGNVYATYLYHQPDDAGGFDPVLYLFKAGPVAERNMDAAYGQKVVVPPRDANEQIQRVHLLHVPEPSPPPAAVEANETAAAAEEEEYGAMAGPDDGSNGHVVATWHVAHRDPVNASTGLSGWIDAAWTTTGANDVWHRLPADQLIGPCANGSNAVHWDGKVYVACVVDKGYADRQRARIGDIDLWEIDMATNSTTLVGHTGMTTTGQVLLAQSLAERDTYVGILSWDHVHGDDDTLQRLEAEVGYAWLHSLKATGGSASVHAADLGLQLRSWGDDGDDLPLKDAHITAFEMTDDTYQSLLVYQEWHDDPQDVPRADADTDPLSIVDNRFTDYNKYLLAFNGCDGPVAGYEAQLGTAVDHYNAQQYAANNGIFNEPRDGLFKTRERNGEELVYFALGDYGAMQYGAVVVHTQSSFCTPPPLPPFAPASAAPQALTTASGASHLMAAGFAAPAAAMVGYMLTVKRRKPQFSTAEDDS